MSKIIISLLLIAYTLTGQIFFIPKVYAVEPCSLSMEITSPLNLYTARRILYFPENSSVITLNFRVTSDNVFNNKLTYVDSSGGPKGKEVHLNFGTGILPGQTSFSQSTTVDVNTRTFTLLLTDETLRKRGEHWGRLEIKDPGKDFEEFCTDIKYQVGAGNTCDIDPNIPKEIPTNTRWTIRFLGNANTEYKLGRGVGDAPRINVLATITTSSDGQGCFPDVLIPGSNGDTLTLTISGTDLPIEASCSTPPIKISDRVPVPGPAPGCDGKILPGTGAVRRVPTGPPAIAKGKPCPDLPDPKNPGIQTAIGCIHTSPVGFTKDLLKFGLGISGGLAFLMMLLGAFQMLTSAGNPETLQTGRDRLTNAVIGLLIVIFAVLLLQIIGIGILNIPGFKP